MLDRLASQGPDMSDIVDFRLSLEPQIAALAAGRRTDADLIVLEGICRTNPLELDQEGSYSLDYQFHVALATATQNQLILTLSQSMYEWIAVARRQIHSTRNGRDTSFSGHLKIFEAVAAGDAERAQTEMRTHIQGASEVETQ
jgi:GntR family transcriptional repressor for pyruvate dehydrogenase complex